MSEQMLAEVFSVSRTPIREAILKLESEKLLDRNGRRGLRVADVVEDEILEVYAIREVLDGLAARLAARSAAVTEVETLRLLNTDLRQLAKNGAFEQMAAANIAFHQTVADAAHNSLLRHFVQQIHDRVRRFKGTTFAYGERAEEAVAEHEAIIDALHERKEDSAERLARLHMANAAKIRLEMVHMRRNTLHEI